jgi:hypothetical protein
MSRAPQLAAPVVEVAELLSDQAASDWLKESLERALLRDPVDALNDALLLASVLETRLRAVFDLTDE